MTDIEIARSIDLQPIEHIASKIGLTTEQLSLYGKYKAKIDAVPNIRQDAKLILVTAINPTAAGEGKTTVSIGLADALNLVGANTCLALREPSLGPVFGIKGGATGGGYSQILPMEDINLHFTGDFHAITTANNLLCSMIDNSIFFGNELDIDSNRVVFNRTMDNNDRALRNVTVSYNVKGATARQDKFNITAACEIMAIMTLASDMNDLIERLGNILVAYDNKGNAVYARQLHAEQAMAILLKDALKPNLVQSIGGTPAIVHCGPFANVSHGCNSIQATKMSMSFAQYTVTEAGFGADLGAEKFLDVKCRIGNLKPNAVVVVATIRALKLHGGQNKLTLAQPNVQAVTDGLPNLMRHVNNIVNVYHLPCVVAINKFVTDSTEEVQVVKQALANSNIQAVECDVWGQGGAGATELAHSVIQLCQCDNSQFSYAYPDNISIEDKINAIATKIYGASNVVIEEKAKAKLQQLSLLGCDNMPVVIAKTQYSFSDDMTKLGAPTDFAITIRDIEPRMGAGYIVAIAGSMLLMPGLPRTPNAVNMTIDTEGTIDGLY